MRDDEKAIMGFVVVVVCAVVGFVIFLIYKCCTFISGENRGSYSQSYSSNESASDPLDLHGYGRDAALNRLQDYLYSKKRAGRYSVTVITGRGLHSQYNRPVLKQAVRNWLDGRGYRYNEHDGDFKVYL